MAARIGFIGLGAMGLPMAKNLLKNGFEVHVAVNRNKAPVEQLKALGAVEQESPGKIASACDILITILPADAEMRDVLLSDEVLGSLSPDGLLIEMTSGSPAMMRTIHEAYREKGFPVLDGPVSGGTAGAEQGTLTVMAGGDHDTLERARPVLEAMASNIFHVGDVGAGKAIKAINQMLAGVHMVAAAEALALAKRLEIDSSVLKQVIGASSGASWMLLNKVDSLNERSFSPGFKLNLMKKDIDIAVNEASDMDLQLAQAALALYRKAEEKNGELDFSAVGRLLLP